MVEELKAFLNQAASADEFSGVVLISKGSQPILKEAYGLADKAGNVSNYVNTKFNLGSMNKMFTAVAVAQLAERGKLSFSDLISKHLPDYPNKGVAAKVTIHHLLMHTSGMGQYQNAKYFAQLGRLRTLSDLIPLFVNDPLAFEPGAKWQYSNSGFIVLGLIVERVSGQNYFDYVREHIYKPAGMTDTDSYDINKDVLNRAIGYMRVGESGQPDREGKRRVENTPTRPARGSSAGGGYSTAEDMLKFAVALQTHKLLGAKYVEQVMSGKVEINPSMGKYAYGFIDRTFDNKHAIGHGGTAPGISAHFEMYPELGYTTVILSNYDPPAMLAVMKKVHELMRRQAQ